MRFIDSFGITWDLLGDYIGLQSNVIKFFEFFDIQIDVCHVFNVH